MLSEASTSPCSLVPSLNARVPPIELQIDCPIWVAAYFSSYHPKRHTNFFEHRFHYSPHSLLHNAFSKRNSRSARFSALICIQHRLRFTKSSTHIGQRLLLYISPASLQCTTHFDSYTILRALWHLSYHLHRPHTPIHSTHHVLFPKFAIFLNFGA
jgi:hypothetical protein